MGTKATDVPKDQDKQQDQDKKDSSQDTTQQTSKQQDQPTNNREDYIKSLEQRIAEQQIANRRLENLVESISKKREDKPAPKIRNIEEERKSFYLDPVGSLDSQLNERDNRILSQMREMLAPIHEVANSFRATSEYDNIKRRLKVDPLFSKAMTDPEVERSVDMLVQSGGIGEISEDSIKSAVAQIYGVRLMSGSTPNNQPPKQDDNRVDPPSIPASRRKVDNSAPETKELTEDDRTAMRYAKLNPNNPEHVKMYWDLIEQETMTLDVHKKG